MDQIKTGKYISYLRKRAGLTQERLGERLGVTNKTVSRWENGNYMPDIEMFRLLAKEFGVSINDLLAGEDIPDGEFRARADENIVEIASSGAFSFEDRKAYFKKKWRREHIFLFIIFGLVYAAFTVLPLIFDKLKWLIAFAPVFAFLGYAYLNNRMMIYAEKRLYDK